MRHHLKEVLFVIGASVLLSMLFLWPALPYFSTQFIGDGGDNYEYASYIGLSGKQLSQGNYPLSYTTFWRYPEGVDFARSFDSYLTLGIGTLWTMLLQFPLSYNLTVITLLTLNGICSYLFFKYISKSTLLGIIGMAIYGFSFYPLAKSGSHLNLLFIGGFPLTAYALLRLCSKQHLMIKDVLFVAFSILLVALGSLQYFILLGIFVLFFLFFIFLFYKPLAFKVAHTLFFYKRFIFGAGIVFLLFFIFFFSPQLISLATGTFQFVGRKDVLFNTTPGIDNFFLPNTYLDTFLVKLFPAKSATSIESSVFLGWVEIVLFVLFLSSKKIHMRFRLFVGSFFLLLFLLSLGYGKENQFFLLPYRFLSHIPPFSIIAEPGRYFVLFYLILATGIILYLKHLPHKKFLFPLLLGILGLVIIERFPISTKVVSALKNEPYVKTVHELTSNAVIDLPINIYYPAYNLLSLYYDKPTVNGYFHWSADGEKQKKFLTDTRLLERYSCNADDPILRFMDDTYEQTADANLLATLREKDITTLVVHKDYKFYHTVCDNVRRRLSLLTPLVEVAKPTMVSKNVTDTQTEGKPSYTVYIPKSGTFYLDGIYIAPQKKSQFFIKTSTGETFDYTWSPIGSPNAFEMLPKNKIQLSLPAGSTITFYSPDLMNFAYFSLWYRYQVDEGATEKPYEPALLKIYEDDKAVVYQL